MRIACSCPSFHNRIKQPPPPRTIMACRLSRFPPPKIHHFKLKPIISASTPLRCASNSQFSLPNPKSRPFSSSPIQYHHHHHHPQWSGLQTWRESPLNENRFWGSTGPEPEPVLPSSIEFKEDQLGSASSLAAMGSIVLSTSDPLLKSRLSHLAYSRWRQLKLPIGVSEPPHQPGRPPKPELVSPKDIPAPKKSGVPLNAYMLHSLAHVELNAIDLAWDTVVRFSRHRELLGDGFFADFAHVADDESRHFAWCSQRLSELGYSYGDMPAHNLLWSECQRSSDNVAARLAVIPLVQEARGLDAGPRLVQKMKGFQDHKTASIVARIAEEEIAHVAVGVSWFVSICQEMGRPPSPTFRDLLKEYNVEPKGPFNYAARDEAGIPRDWYDPSYMNKTDTNEQLSEVYDRLACIIAMEKENSSLNKEG